MSDDKKPFQSAVQVLRQNLPENSGDLLRIKGLTTAFYCRNCFLMNYAGITLNQKVFASFFSLSF